MPAPDSRPPGRGGFSTLRTLFPYLWPPGQTGLKLRVVAALLCLFAAKAATVYVPILYKHAIDELGQSAPGAVTVPLGLILAYGAARVLSLLFSELRDAIFARVGQHAIRSVGLQIFRHLHGLALRFHLTRQTGGLTRAIERGTKGIQTLLSLSLIHI